MSSKVQHGAFALDVCHFWNSLPLIVQACEAERNGTLFQLVSQRLVYFFDALMPEAPLTVCFKKGATQIDK